MTTISILPEPPSASGERFRDVAGRRHSTGGTPGEALDALSSQLNDDESGTLLVVQSMRPDRFFTADQQSRLTELFDRWRAARDAGGAFTADEQAELERLTEAEQVAAGLRAKTLLDAARR